MKENELKTQNQEPKKGVKVLKAIINTVINIMIVLVLITSILIAVMALTSKASGISTIFGYTIQTIQSDSMKGGSPDGYPEGDFGTGDLMIAKATGDNSNVEYDVGDIVTFIEQDTDGNNVYIVHRIINKVAKDDGNFVYQTQGDNRTMSEVPDQRDESEYLLKGQFVSVYYTEGYKGTIIKGVGGFLDYLRSQQGFFFVVLLPMIIFFLYALIRVVLSVSGYKKTKAEEEKEAAVKEAVAAAKAERGMNDLPESLADMTPEQLEQFKQFMAQQNAQAPKAEADTASEAPVEEPETALESEKSTED